MSTLAFARINYFHKEASLASPGRSRQIRHVTASLECTQPTTSEEIQGIGKGAKESSKAKLGGEPTPGRAERVPLWRNTSQL